MKKKHNQQTDAELAKIYHCNVKTISRWRAAGAPLADAARMRAWLTTRKHIPPGTAALLSASRAVVVATVADVPGDLLKGPAAALKRLEGAEVASYRAFNRAVADGDSVTVKTTRENWLRIVESLRKLDLQVGLDGRELIPKAEVERDIKQAINIIQAAMGRAFGMTLPVLLRGAESDFIARELDKCYENFRRIVREQFASLCSATPDTTEPKA